MGGGGKGGGGGSADVPEEFTELANLQRQIAEQLFEQTGPLRDLFLGTPSGGGFLGLGGGSQGILERFVETGETPLALGAFAPLREATEDQFNVARENIIGRAGARGGQLTQGLIDLESDRARTIAGIELPLRQNLFNIATGAALGSPGQAISGLGAAGGTFGTGFGIGLQEEALAQQQAIAQSQGAGALAGLGVGAASLAGAGPLGIAAGGLGGLLGGSIGKF